MDDRIIRARIEGLRRRAVRGSASINGWEARTADHRGPADYSFDGPWAPAPEPGAWPAGKTLFLRTRAALPAAGAGETRYMVFDMHLMEGLFSIDERPFAGIDAEHPRVALAAAGEHELSAEILCVPSSFHTPAARREKALLREVRCDAVVDEVEALAWDTQFAWEAARRVADARRRALLDAAVEKALLAVDLTAPEADFRGAVTAARGLLQALVGSIGCDPEEGRVFLTGHSHIDTAWLWPLRETIRKCGRTFATACRLMERYPEYRFTCSQPQLYAYTKQHFPGLYDEIRAWVAAGRWECTGGMWVEADCNVPSGESLIRQVLHGVAFFTREFGRRPRSCWLPDVFGYPGSLPGILAGCGIENFYTNKLHWQARNPFPTHLFRWEGIDGESVLAHIPRLRDYYNGSPTPEQLRVAWDGFSEKGSYNEVMLPFGFGDGGGGPTPAMLEMAHRARAFPGLPACRQGLEEEYFEEVRKARPEIPAWVGELYLETHRGTYTTQSEVKRANRKNELLLRDAEILTSLAGITGTGAAPGTASTTWARLGTAWEALLLHQFHDILPGSSIGEVYRDAAAVHAEIAQTASAIRDQALLALSGASAPGTGAPKATRASASFRAYNTLSWERGDPVLAQVPHSGKDLEVLLADGKVVPAQVIDGKGNGPSTIAFVAPSIPSVGAAGFTVRPARAVPSPFHVKGRTIESPYYRVELDDDGAITRLLDVRRGREVVSEGAAINRLQLFQDGPEVESAWNIHAVFEKRPYAWDPGTTVEVVEDGPVRLVVRVMHRYRESRIEQDMILWAGFDRIDFVTRADWRARQVLLKAAFPVRVRSDRAAFEIQFGAVYRATHANTSWEQEKFEVCAHRWMDISEPGYGVSVFNDSRYGCDARGSVMRLTLLRGAEWPDPDADKGMHELTYALYPHAGDWTEAHTVRRAWELNVPVVCRPEARAGDGKPAASLSLLSVSGPAILETLKRAENGDGWILRLYEPHGGRGPVTVTTPMPLSSVLTCNHVEEDAGEWPCEGASFGFTALPFKVYTFRVRF